MNPSMKWGKISAAKETIAVQSTSFSFHAGKLDRGHHEHELLWFMIESQVFHPCGHMTIDFKYTSLVENSPVMSGRIILNTSDIDHASCRQRQTLELYIP